MSWMKILLARCRRVLGEDHSDTLRAANNLANDLRQLGEVQSACELDEDTLSRRRRVLAKTTRTVSALPTMSPLPCTCWARCRHPVS